MQLIDYQSIANRFSYADYRNLVEKKLEKGQLTGLEPTEELLDYARLNLSRMARLEKTARLTDESLGFLKNEVKTPVVWLTVTEGWCGDAAQIVPVLEKMAAENPLIEHVLILRDQNLEIIDAFLTSGGRAIPKVIFLEKSSGKVLGAWGPRPAEAQNLMEKFKAEMAAATDPDAKKATYEAAKTAIHTWYAHDKTRSTQADFLAAFRTALKNLARLA